MDKERIINLFTELTAVDSLSRGERRMADILAEELRRLGFDVIEDDAGEKIGSDTGNLYAFLKGTDPGKKPVLLSAHMDTVVPGIGKKAVVDHEAGVITSQGDTILGADDVAGIVQILEGVRYVTGSGSGYGDIEVLFTVAEEVYGLGASAFDYSRIRSGSAYVIDMSGRVGKAAVAAPSIITFGFTVKGRPAHAGFDPGAGINAIAIASDIIAETKQGLVSDGLTLNIGTISGGSVSNIVSETCSCTGEVRGSDHDAACRALDELRDRVERKAAAAGASCTFDSEVMIKAYRTDESEDVCGTFLKACRGIGVEPEFVSTRGGSDNNVFALHGIPGIVVGCGMRNTHSTSEYIYLDDLFRGVELVSRIIQER
ncbi:MAG: M20/M25/M40 family metallo-hydrolase [Clostridiales bacterium]|nr:M20/M25/M40 family metallo-hydrolase [Clostridiales bacterium]